MTTLKTIKQVGRSHTEMDGGVQHFHTTKKTEMDNNSVYRSTPALQEFNNDKFNSVRGKFKNVSTKENIINDFSCALKKELLLHGRLYIGIEQFYFASNILGYETKIEEKWSNVISVQKAKLANIIPNAIKIITTDAKYIFASFSNRTYTYELISCALKNFKDDTNYSGNELKDMAKKNVSNSDRSKDNIQYESSELEYKSSTLVLDKYSKVKKVSSDGGTSSETSPYIISPFTPNTALCSCDHLKQELCLKLFSVNIDDIFNVLYDDTSIVMKRVFEKYQFKEYKIESRTTLDDGSVCRVSTHVVPNAFMGHDASTRVEETFPHTNKSNIHYHIISKTTSSGISFADQFEILMHTCLYAIEKRKTVYKSSIQIQFNEKVRWSTPKNIIEKSAIKTASSICDEIVSELTYLFGKPEDIKAIGKPNATRLMPSTQEMIVEATKDSIINPASERIVSSFRYISNSLIMMIFLYLLYVMICQHNEILQLKSSLEFCYPKK